MMTLVWRSFGRVSTAWMASALVLVVFQVAIIAAAVSLERAGNFTNLVNAVPAFVRDMIYPALASFAGMSVLAYIEPLVVLLLTLFAVYVASEPAGDVESGIVDLVLSRPVPRHWLISRSLLLMTAAVIGFVLVLTATNQISMRLAAPPGAAWPAPRVVPLLAVHLFALAWCFGGLTLGVAASLPRRAPVIGSMTVAILALYLLDVLVESSTRFSSLWWTTPFHYSHGMPILTGTAHTARNLIVLLGLGSIGVTAAYWKFNHRDV